MGARINLSKLITMRDAKVNIEADSAILEEIMFATSGYELGVYVNGAWVWIGIAGTTSGEALMQDGVISPPVPIENEAEDDWLYAD
jgi:hypothetical protein